MPMVSTISSSKLTLSTETGFGFTCPGRTLGAGTGSADDEANRKPDTGSSKSPVDLTIEFLSKGNLEDLVQQRLAEKETKVLK